MGDPLSTAASIIAVLQLTSSVIKYINTAKGANKDRKSLRDEIRACEDILNQLKDNADDTDDEEYEAWQKKIKALEAPGAPLGRLKTALNSVDAKLRPKRDTRTQKAVDSLKWPFKEKEVSDMLAAIEREKALLLLALQNDFGSLIREIKRTTNDHKKKLQELIDTMRQTHDELMELKHGVDKIRDDQDKEKDARIREEIDKWLARVNYAARHGDVVLARLKGTGQWLLDSAEFDTWINSSKKTLFCHGIPGAGKTIITSIVVDHLFDRFRDDETVGVAYVYCDFNRPSDQTAQFLLMDILQQLSHRRLSVPDCMKTLHSKYKGQGIRPPSLDDIFTTLQSVCQLYKKVFIVVDALDECQPSHAHRPTFLKQIIDLHVQHDVNIFATSRPIPEITEMFMDSLNVEISAQTEDVGKYVDSRIPEMKAFVRERPELQNKIKRNIVKVVEGMFLLAKLHLDSLVSKHTPKLLKQALANLPSGRHATAKTYEEALNRIESQGDDQVDLAKKALSWITCTRKPMTGRRLRHALAVEIGEPEFDEENLSRVEDIVSVCAGLITVDTESKTVRLIHYTAQEFFAVKQKEWLPYAQTELTRTCVTYLLFDVSDAGSVEYDYAYLQGFQSHSLYNYAACNWGHHARIAATEGGHAVNSKSPDRAQHQELSASDATQRMILQFLTNDNKLAVSNQSLLRDHLEWRSVFRDPPTDFKAMHTAAFFGLVDTMVILLGQGHDPSAQDSDGGTPLWWAAREGHAMVVETLLRTAGVKPDAKDSKFEQTPLSVAAKNGHEAIVTKLLETKGVDPNSRDDNGQTPLSLAAENGQDAIVAKLLETKGMDPNSRDRFGRTPLSIAAENGRQAIVTKLLETGSVDPDARNEYGRTPLSWAAENGHEATVTKLLKTNGVDPESQDTFGRTPLSRAAGPHYTSSAKGQPEVMSILLAQDCVKADAKDNSRRTPLSYAAGSDVQAAVKVQILLAKDVDVNTKDNHGRTPLSHAAESDNAEAIQALIAVDGIDVNAKDNDGRTPLSHAAKRGNAEAIQTLTAISGIDVNTKDNDGRTPLSHAAESDNAEGIQALIAVNGIDINSTDDQGLSALALATRDKDNPKYWKGTKREYEAIIRLLTPLSNI